MNKGKIARLAGFVGVLGVTTVLITTAVSGTGAYFSDAHPGSLQGTAGHLTLTTGGDPLAISFTDLIPGVDQTAHITFAPTSGSPNADVWLVFTPNTTAYGAFTGNKTFGYPAYTGGGLGQYGHVKVAGGQGYSFESYNLQLPAGHELGQAPYTSTGNGGNQCNVDGNGNGGSSTQHAVGQGTDLAECGVPAAILIAHDVPANVQGTAAITFGLTGKAAAQNQENEPKIPFNIVATQVGINPSGPNW